MRLLFLGDMVGRTGRTAVWDRLPGLISDFRLDFVIVNGENAAGGFGITEEIFRLTLDAGADVVSPSRRFDGVVRRELHAPRSVRAAMPRSALRDDHRARSRGVPGGKRDADGRPAAAEPDRRIQRRDVRKGVWSGVRVVA